MTRQEKPSALHRLHAAARSGRRGSFIVLVVGMLALMTIVAVVYFSIGQGDARASAALLSASSREEMPRAVSQYIASIIASDATNVVDPGIGTPDRAARYLYEGWDYPYTSTIARSRTSTKGLWFRPEGTFGDDPWLGATEPTILGTGLISVDPPTDAWELYQYKRDWLHLSNIAPDGNAVNLWNLRPPSAGGPTGGGIGASPLDMRRSLSLFDAGSATVPGTLGYMQLDDDTTAVDPLIPAHFFNRQRNAFRPANDTVNGYDDATYLLYQFADADGDGWIDSRWQELVNAVNPAIDPVYVVEPTDGMRYFVAATIRDLSARVNVNIGTDLVVAPNFQSPSGITPADVDVRTILTMQDSYELYGQSGLGSSVGDGTEELNIPNPTDASSVWFYGDQTAIMARDVGRFGYNAMRLGIETSIVPPPRTDLAKFAITYLGGGGGTTSEDRTMKTPVEREASFLKSGASSSSASLTESGLALAGGYGLSDLVELLTFRSANDPEQVSLLESAVGGRFPMTGTDSSSTRRYSPLRDNRPAEFERPMVTLDDDELLDQMLLSFAIDVRQRLTTLSGSRPIRPSMLKTTATPPAVILNLALEGDSTSSAYSFSTSINDLLSARDIQRAFHGYADALLPYTGKISGQWNRGSTFNQTRYMSYGYDGPELALRFSAHMAANLFAATYQAGTVDTKDMEPFAYTVLVNEGARATLDSEATAPIAGRTFKQAWWSEDANKLDLAAERPNSLALTSDTTQASAVTVFGVKPQPVITQVTSFTVYVDAPTTLGGDDDGASMPPGIPPEPIDIPQVTIEGSTTWGDPDYLGRIVAVQLTNPFDKDIYLSGEERTTDGGAIGASENDFTYYLQLGVDADGTDERVYRLAAIETEGVAPGTDLQAIVLKAGESRNFVILDTNYVTMRNRWSAMSAAFNPLEPVDTAILTNWLDKQLGVTQVDGTNIAPVIIPEISRVTGIRPASPGAIFSGSTSEDRTVRLWRVMTSDIAGDDLSASGGLNAWENDYLVDRLRDPGTTSTLNQTLNLPDDAVVRSRAEDQVLDTPSARPTRNDNTGFTVVLHSSVRRPDASVPTGSTGIPAYAIESRTNNRNKTVTNPYSPPSREDFVGNEDGAYWNFNWFLAETSDAPSFVDGATVSLDELQPSAKQHPGTKSGGGIGSNLSGSAYATIVPEFPEALEDKYDTRTLRPGDMLLPFAVGPWVEMDSSGAALIDESAGDDWYTLGEALALALDYDRGAAGNITADLGSPDRNPGIGFPRPATDGANLVLDDYVLFKDVNTDGQFTYGIGSTDIRFGVGIPAAVTVMDLFHTMDDQFRDERVVTPGQINIATATEETLRAVRLLSPSNPWGDSWGGVLGASHNETSDIASMIVAYRDKIPVYPRRPGAFDPVLLLDFADTNDASENFATELDDDGRFFTTDIPGLRETPGFRSLGELAILRDTRPSNPDAQLHSIDRLGTETPPTDSGGPGIDAGFYSDVLDGLSNEYSERLAIANSVSNIFSVRSDYYAVWFVLHGYQASDVSGLKPTEPLVPSVARRFLMIVDRSNVTAPGDEPQIVVFKELPY